MAAHKIPRTRMLLSITRIVALVAVVTLIQFGSAKSANINQNPTREPIFHEANRDKSALVAYGTAEASERLMKELKEILKSDAYKNGVFSVGLENGDNLYEWNVKLFIINPGQLHDDLQQFKKDGEEDHILLKMYFEDDYPNEPPFVRVIYPILKGEFMMHSGVICMDMLTRQNWVRSFDAQTVILSIADLLVSGETEVDKTKGLDYIRERYSLGEAEEDFKHVEHSHEPYDK